MDQKKTNLQLKTYKQNPKLNKLFPIQENEDFIVAINLAGTLDTSRNVSSKYLLDMQTHFNNYLLKKYRNLDPVTRQKKSWHNHKTKPRKAISLSWKTKQ